MQIRAFDDWLRSTLGDETLSSEERIRKLCAWEAAPSALEAHPKGGAEHLMPLFVALGAAGEAAGGAFPPVNPYIHTYIYIYIYMYVCMYVYVYVCICICICIFIYICMYMHIYAYAYIYAYACIYI